MSEKKKIEKLNIEDAKLNKNNKYYNFIVDDNDLSIDNLENNWND